MRVEPGRVLAFLFGLMTVLAGAATASAESTWPTRPVPIILTLRGGKRLGYRRAGCGGQARPNVAPAR